MTDEEMAGWLASTVVNGKEIARSLMATLGQQDSNVDVFATLSALKMMRESLIMCAQEKMSEDERAIFTKEIGLIELASVVSTVVRP